MSDGIAQIAKRLNERIASSYDDALTRVSSNESTDKEYAARTLSNAGLLLQAIVAFYSEPQSKYFPPSITTIIHDRLVEIENTLSTILGAEPASLAEQAPTFLNSLESLYVYCLQFGLITYGFTGKQASEIIRDFQQRRQRVDERLREILAHIEKNEAVLTENIAQFEQSLGAAVNTYETASKDAVGGLKEHVAVIAAMLDTAKSSVDDITSYRTAVSETVTAVNAQRADVDAAATAVAVEFAAHRAKVESEVSTVQTLSKQAQSAEADAKTNIKAVVDARAAIKDQLKQITEFYAEIEEHRREMTEVGKTAQERLAELQESSDRHEQDLRERTEKVVTKNEELIGQINDHLRKAIGVSLFTAFDRRRRHISIASWVWGILLLLSVGGAIYYAIWFAKNLVDLKSDMHAALIYARLVIAAPLAFLITFTARRYAGERRAEEEYAFKSAISVSLDSYRELVARMKMNGDDTEFIQRLILEVFDNPTKRLYGGAKSASEVPDSEAKEILDGVLDRVLPRAD